MSIFKKRISSNGTAKATKPIDPTEIFKHLTPSEDGYDYLRDVQKEFLTKWNEIREQRDVVGKLNTGAGKTLLALLMLKSKLHEGLGPVVYLCPDNQLVNQAVGQAKLFNIPVVTILHTPKQRAEFPIEYLNKEAILICTFERLFNGRSIFGVEGSYSREIQEIGALVVDDAHSCIKKARKQSTIILRNDHEYYSKIFQLFEDSLRQQGEGSLAAIKTGESSISQLVPYWAWNQQRQNVLNILTQLLRNEDPAVFYSWGLIGNELNQCECYVSADYIEITPLKLPIQQIPSFYNAEHRYFLSATFSDDTELLKELGVEREAIENPIKPENKGDVGERLIITPKRYHLDLDDTLMRKFIAEYAKEHNVVIIVPNTEKTKLWKDYNPEIVTKDNIASATNKLKSSIGNLMVFVARYDGIDLAGDACRILVLDGKPTAHTQRDKYDQIVRQGSPLLNAQVAQTVEQGLGRAVRSGSDFCNVFILDNSLINFMAKKDNQRFFGPETQAQVKFGLEIFEGERPQNVENAIDEIKDAIDAVLNRDPQWRTFHKEMILNVDDEDNDNDTSHLLSLADTYTNSVQLFKDEEYEAGANMLLDYVETHKGLLSEMDQAWYTQTAASMVYPINSTRASDLQVKAKKLYSRVLKPLTPYLSKLTKTKGKQSEIIKGWLTNYENGTDVYIAIEELITNLHYSNDIESKLFEEAVYDIGRFLGFASQRPEEDEGDGPDNLWRTEEGLNIIIEAKNQRTGDKIPRGDVEQLLHSIQWHRERYGENQKYIPIMLHPSNRTDTNAHASEDSKVMDKDKLNEFKNSLLKLGEALSSKVPTSWTENEIHRELSRYGLNYNQLFERYTRRMN